METKCASLIHGFAEYGYYYQRTLGRRLSDELHTHDFYEFFYIISGTCVHETDGKECVLSAGDLVAMSPGTAHRFLSQSYDTDVAALSVTPDAMNAFFTLYGFGSFSDSSSVSTLSDGKAEVLAELCEQIRFAGINESTVIRMLLNQIFLFSIKLTDKKYIPTDFSLGLEKMREIANAAEGMSAFVRLSGYSRSQLCRLTRQHLGITPREYINSIRLDHAYRLLVYENFDVESACHAVGFESLSYFNKLIKNKFGCTPAVLKKHLGTLGTTV